MVRPSNQCLKEATARNDDGRVTFRRNGVDDAELIIEYTTSPKESDLSRGGLSVAIEEIRNDEIEHMRTTLRQLGDELSEQLPKQGKLPVMKRKAKNHDERTWVNRGTAFAVDPSTTRYVEQLRGYVGVSDSALVQETIRLFIEQREKDIHSIYVRILADAEKR